MAKKDNLLPVITEGEQFTTLPEFGKKPDFGLITITKAFLGWTWYVSYEGKKTGWKAGRSLTRKMANRQANKAFKRLQRGIV